VSRKPVNLQMIGGKTPRQHIWEQIRNLRRFTLDQLRGELSGAIHRDTLKTYLKSLLAGGYLNVDTIDGRPGYNLARDVGAEAPRVREDGTAVVQGLGQEQLWRTLRIMRNPMTAVQIAGHASIPEVAVSPVATEDYLQRLTQAGYLERTGQGKHAKYRLINDSGPLPPQIQRVKQVFDPNWNRVVWRDGEMFPPPKGANRRGGDGRA
jgi:hypothetical protein